MQDNKPFKVIGIIGEYNPFHNGHLYHLKKIKEMFPHSLIILVLNGYFLERGEISLLSKKDKVELAIFHNIDLVLELPFVFGTQSADIFAYNSIKILELLKCDYVIFGSECNDINKLYQICDLMHQDDYDNKVKNYLKQGVNYPTALAKSLNIDFAFKPNDLLGISYLKAIINNQYHIKPLTIKRTNDYLDISSNEPIISAKNIREKIKTNYTLNGGNDNLSQYLDVDEGIENRLRKYILKATNTHELMELIKTKRYTYNKIRRMFIHILIGLTKEDNQKLSLDYLKVLGFNSLGKNYLKNIKKELVLPNSLKGSLVYSYELKSALLYDLICSKKDAFNFDKTNKPIYYDNN